MSTLKTTYIKNPDNTGTSNVELEQSGTITVSGGVNASGIITASSFSGDITGTSATFSGGVNASGIITASSFSGDITGTASNASGATGDFSIADKIVHTGDTDTAIRFPAVDTFTVETGGSERVRVDSSGRLLLGTDSGTGKLIVQDSSLPKVQANFNGTKHLEMGVGGSGGGFSMTTGHFLTINHQPYANRGSDANLTERFRIGPSGQIGLGGANYGTSGQVLTSNGSSSAPTWQTGGGAWNLISTVTASAAATVTFQGDLDSTYKQYVLIVSELTSDDNTSSEPKLNFMVGATELTDSTYDTNGMRKELTSSTMAPTSFNDQAYGRLFSGPYRSSTLPDHFGNLEIWFNGGRNSTHHAASFRHDAYESATNSRIGSGLVTYSNASAQNVDGVRIAMTSGNVTGTFKLYGIS